MEITTIEELSRGRTHGVLHQLRLNLNWRAFGWTTTVKGLGLYIRGKDPRFCAYWVMSSHVVPVGDLVDIDSLVFS